MDDQWLYKIGDSFFFAFHIVLIIFNLFGWISKRLRMWNFISLSATAFSWFILGIFHGLGFCFLTEWHWLIREALGHTNESNSYIHFLLIELFDISVSEKLVNIFTGLFFFAAVVASVYVNFIKRKPNDNRRST